MQDDDVPADHAGYIQWIASEYDTYDTMLTAVTTWFSALAQCPLRKGPDDYDYSAIRAVAKHREVALSEYERVLLRVLLADLPPKSVEFHKVIAEFLANTETFRASTKYLVGRAEALGFYENGRTHARSLDEYIAPAVCFVGPIGLCNTAESAVSMRLRGDHALLDRTTLLRHWSRKDYRRQLVEWEHHVADAKTS
jgi:hypothetical protein